MVRNKGIDISSPSLSFSFGLLNAEIDRAGATDSLSEISSIVSSINASQYRYENGRRYHSYREGRM